MTYELSTAMRTNDVQVAAGPEERNGNSESWEK